MKQPTQIAVLQTQSRQIS